MLINITSLIMGREGFEPSISGLKDPRPRPDWATDPVHIIVCRGVI